MLALFGNHDRDFFTSKGNGFRSLFGLDSFSWRFGSNLFIALNNVELARQEQQRAWLRETLARQAGPEDNLFLLMHKPPIPRDESDPASYSKHLPADIVREVKKVRQVQVFAGHEHAERTYDYHGIKVTVFPNVGDFSGQHPEQLVYYLMDCRPQDCSLSPREVHYLLSPWDVSSLLARLLVDYYWGWLIIAVLALGGAGISRRARKKHVAAGLKSAP
jgi:hypothetical protein